MNHTAIFSASLLILVLALLRRPLLSVLPKRALPPLWGLCLLRLSLPFSLPSPVPLPAPQLRGAVAAVALAPKTAGVPFLPLLWGCGSVALGLWFVLTHLKFRREYRQALPLADGRMGAFLEAHPLRRKVRILVLDTLFNPLTYGVFRPVILLPKSGYSDQELQLILTHEHTHIRRFHTLYKLLLAAALCLFWWNPCVWLLYFFANRDLELSCDEQVLLRCGLQNRGVYARLLIALEERKTGLVPLSSYLCQNLTEERIRSIMKAKKLTISGLAVALLITAGAITAFAADAKKPETSTPAPTPIVTTSSTAVDDAEVGLAFPEGTQYKEVSPGVYEVTTADGTATFRITEEGGGSSEVSYLVEDVK